MTYADLWGLGVLTYADICGLGQLTYTHLWEFVH